MKHIQKSNEPTKLQKYRETNPDRRWEHFRNECQLGLEEIYTTLSNDQGGICVYCEMTIRKPNHQVEHFHDKSDDSDSHNRMKWQLDWNNMWYACVGGTNESDDTARIYDADMIPIKNNYSCGQHKQIGDYQIILSPQSIPPFPRIFTYKIGENSVSIHADPTLCNVARIDPSQVDATINLLNLNCKRLCAARWAVLKQINTTLANALSKTQPSSDQYKILVSRLIGNKYENGLWNQFFTMIRWRFNNAAEKYLEEIRFHG
jgi:uncharacterized protein (TIGR02646 family)